MPMQLDMFSEPAKGRINGSVEEFRLELGKAYLYVEFHIRANPDGTYAARHAASYPESGHAFPFHAAYPSRQAAMDAASAWLMKEARSVASRDNHNAAKCAERAMTWLQSMMN